MAVANTLAYYNTATRFIELAPEGAHEILPLSGVLRQLTGSQGILPDVKNGGHCWNIDCQLDESPVLRSI
jgi:hypothetical protein